MNVISFTEFLQFFNFPFVWYALIICVLTALCAALLGVTLVLKRFSFIGDGLSHVAFGGQAIAAVVAVAVGQAFDFNDTFIVLPVTVLAAILLLRTGGRKTKLNGDATLALISVSSLALGYLIYSFSNAGNLAGDVCTTLFGSSSILMVNATDLWICIAMSVLVILVYVLFYNKIFGVTFDETFAKATGVKTGAYNLLIAVVIAFIIVLAMNLVGSLLISALVIFPALSAMRVFKSFKLVVICSAIVSVVCSVLGVLLSIWLSTPVGSTIVAIDLLAFLAFTLAGKLRARTKSA